jgi:cytochrome P450
LGAKQTPLHGVDDLMEMEAFVPESSGLARAPLPILTYHRAICGLDLPHPTIPFPAEVPSVSRARAFFESVRMARDPIALLSEHSCRLGDTFRYYLGGIREILVTSRPSILAHILKTNWENYRKPGHMRHFLGEGLLTSDGERWRHQRRHFQTSFRTDRLASALPLMHASLEESTGRLDAVIDQGPVDIAREMTAMTFAMFARSMLGADVSAWDVELLSNAITRIQEFIVRQIATPFLSPWFHISGAVRKHDALRREADAAVLKHITKVRGSDDRHENLVDDLWRLTDADTGQPLDPELVLAECMHILVAGHETSSNVLTWTLYLLARHPTYLDRCRREFAEILGGDRLSAAHLPALKLTTAVLDEAMRLYPVIWMMDRDAVLDDNVDGIAIPAGTRVVAFIYGVHHSPQFWREPERFLPERFQETGHAKMRQKFQHLPFGGGPHQCIGSGFAYLQMFVILSVLLPRYDFALVSDHPISFRPLIILRPRGGMRMHVRRRQTILSSRRGDRG